MTITVEHEGFISRVILNRPSMNLLDIETMDALVEAHHQADAHEKSRVILTESKLPQVFSNGLDPLYVLKKDNSARIEVFRAVGRMLHGLYSLKKPHIGLINGPAMAGGAILAITADFRVFDRDWGRLSFSEPKVGLPIPAPVVRVIGQFCNPKNLRDVVLLGQNMDAVAAREAGFADAVAETSELAATVHKLAGRLARLSPAVLRETKRGLRREILHETAAFVDGSPDFDPFVDDLFLGEGLRALVEDRFPDFVR